LDRLECGRLTPGPGAVHRGDGQVVSAVEAFRVVRRFGAAAGASDTSAAVSRGSAAVAVAFRVAVRRVVARGLAVEAVTVPVTVPASPSEGAPEAAAFDVRAVRRFGVA